LRRALALSQEAGGAEPRGAWPRRVPVPPGRPTVPIFSGARKRTPVRIDQEASKRPDQANRRPSRLRLDEAHEPLRVLDRGPDGSSVPRVRRVLHEVACDDPAAEVDRRDEGPDRSSCSRAFPV